MSDFTTFLFANPTTTSGVARLVDFGSTFDCYNTSDTPAEADAAAIERDWRVVGNDLREVVEAALSRDA